MPKMLSSWDCGGENKHCFNTKQPLGLENFSLMLSLPKNKKSCIVFPLRHMELGIIVTSSY